MDNMSVYTVTFQSYCKLEVYPLSSWLSNTLYLPEPVWLLTTWSLLWQRCWHILSGQWAFANWQGNTMHFLLIGCFETHSIIFSVIAVAYSTLTLLILSILLLWELYSMSASSCKVFLEWERKEGLFSQLIQSVVVVSLLFWQLIQCQCFLTAHFITNMFVHREIPNVYTLMDSRNAHTHTHTHTHIHTHTHTTHSHTRTRTHARTWNILISWRYLQSESYFCKEV